MRFLKLLCKWHQKRTGTGARHVAVITPPVVRLGGGSKGGLFCLCLRKGKRRNTDNLLHVWKRCLFFFDETGIHVSRFGKQGRAELCSCGFA